MIKRLLSRVTIPLVVGDTVLMYYEVVPFELRFGTESLFTKDAMVDADQEPSMLRSPTLFQRCMFHTRRLLASPNINLTRGCLGTLQHKA